jgi:hypothetical protein
LQIWTIITSDHLRGQMLKIQRSPKEQGVVFVLSGRMDAENLSELETLLRKEASDSRTVLDLKDLTLVDQDVVSFLRGREADGIQLRNCPAYIRAWINGPQ